MNWRGVITDALIIFMVIFFFIFFMPYQVNKYLNRCRPDHIELSPQTIRMMQEDQQWEREIPDDIDWDIEEVINTSDYIDDLDTWQDTFGNQSWKNK